jgi:hypothetical protein
VLGEASVRATLVFYPHSNHELPAAAMAVGLRGVPSRTVFDKAKQVR